ncbi:MAG TPA: HIT family protein [archaeon]|nr:HIT family protein [archaeon]
MAECVFCRIADAQKDLVYEDEDFFAVLDIKPRGPGHTLVIPKAHHRWVWDVPDIGRYFEAVGKVAKALQKAMDTEFVVMVVMGEEIAHAHVHLVPRLPGDPHGVSVHLGEFLEMGPEQLREIAGRVRAALQG